MKEILFRGKRSNGEWVDGYYLKSKMNANEATLYDYISVPHPDVEGATSDDYRVDPETVCQFTGVYDKNGKRIFERERLVARRRGRNHR